MKLNSAEYAQRRRTLLAQLPEHSLVILPSAPVTTRNRDVEHPFRQDSNFYYLSGFAEEFSVLVLIPGREQGEYVLFCQEKIKEQETWTGRRLGPQAAPEVLGCDEAYPISAIDEILPQLMADKTRIYANFGAVSEFDQRIFSWVNQLKAQVRNGISAPQEFCSLEPLLHDMRLIKSAAEIELMHAACDISAKAHMRVMKSVRPGMMEYQLEAELMRDFMAAGSRWPAYPSIVGTGENACILHYTANNTEIKDGDLILIDAGCELDYYASDITRTFPANGKFSPAQAALYQLVLDANLAAIQAVRPGVSFDEPHQVAVRVLTAGLIELGILQGELNTLIKDEAYKPFYMHKTGHWLGMDVHDVGDYRVDGQWRELKPGMVLTIEPGLYIDPDNTQVAEQWRGIGIRIEDDVAVTATGCQVLTSAVVKAIAEIEALHQ